MFYVTSCRKTEAGNVDVIMREEGEKENIVFITTLPEGATVKPGTRIDATLTPWSDAEGREVEPVTLPPQKDGDTEVTVCRVDLDEVTSVQEPVSRAAANLSKLQAAGWGAAKKEEPES